MRRLWYRSAGQKHLHGQYLPQEGPVPWPSLDVYKRQELIRHAELNDHLIIEDDFENEFVYFQKPTPSLFGLAGGENVVYIGSFSRLLLPSIRVSFMVPVSYTHLISAYPILVIPVSRAR